MGLLDYGAAVAAENKAKKDFYAPCKQDRYGNRYMKLGGLYRGLGVACIVLALLNLAGCLVFPQYYQEDGIGFWLLLMGLCVGLLIGGIVFLRIRYILTDSELICRVVRTKSYPLDSILRMGKTPRSTNPNKAKLVLHDEDGRKIKVTYGQCHGAAHFIKLLGERTDLPLFATYVGLPADYQFEPGAQAKPLTEQFQELYRN